MKPKPKPDPVIDALKASQSILAALSAGVGARQVSRSEMRKALKLVKSGIDERFVCLEAIRETVRLVESQWLYQG